MNIATTIATIDTRVASITGITNHKVGMPNEIDLGGHGESYYPLAVISGPHNFHWQRAGMGVTGAGFAEYDVRITVAVGSKNASESVAIQRAIPLLDRFREEFAPDWTLSGAIFNADLIPTPADNLDTFRDLGQPPLFQLTLHVQEYSVANAVAA